MLTMDDLREQLALTLYGDDPDGGWGQSQEWERVVLYQQADAVLARFVVHERGSKRPDE